jgi:nitrous oxidase accessory protein
MFSNNDEYLHNRFTHNGAGVAVMFSHHITMTDNIFEHNWGPSSYGLLLKDIVDGTISGNRFEENTFGIYADGSNRIIMENNEFMHNGWALKILGSCSDNVITLNNFEGNSFDVITNTSSSTNRYLKNYWSDYTGYDLDRNGVGDVPYRPVKLFSYIVGNIPSSIILLRSAFVDLVNFAEKVAPSITPGTLIDPEPMMRRIVR